MCIRDSIEIEEFEEDVEVPFAVIENVPVFPGCERGNNEKKRKCMSDKIAKFVQRNFKTDLARGLGLSGRQRISVIFKIDRSGNVTGVRARAPHPQLEDEAIRVISTGTPEAVTDKSNSSAGPKTPEIGGVRIDIKPSNGF